MLIDRKRIRDVILKGIAEPLDAPAHPLTAVYPPHPLVLPFDIEKAKKYLAEDGWELNPKDNILYKTFDGQRVPFKFTLLIVSGQPDYVAMANQIKDAFAQAGITVNVSNLEWTVFQQKIENLEFEAMILGWQMTLESDPYQIFIRRRPWKGIESRRLQESRGRPADRRRTARTEYGKAH